VHRSRGCDTKQPIKLGTTLIVAAGLCCAQPVLEAIRINRHLATPMRDGKFPVLVVRTP